MQMLANVTQSSIRYSQPALRVKANILEGPLSRNCRCCSQLTCVVVAGVLGRVNAHWLTYLRAFARRCNDPFGEYSSHLAYQWASQRERQYRNGLICTTL